MSGSSCATTGCRTVIQILYRYPRSLLLRMEQPHRSAMAHHVTRSARLGAPVSIIESWYKPPSTINLRMSSPGVGTVCGDQVPSGPPAKERGAGDTTVVAPLLICSTDNPRSFCPSWRKRNTPSAPLNPDGLVSTLSE